MHQELAAFLTGWEEDPHQVKPLFSQIYEALQAMPEAELSFKGRSGISYSLRAKHPAQKKRDLFVLVDVIDDEPEARWLSICFYADQVTDPDTLGDTVPGGLGGEDACCFDLDSQEHGAYILERIKEAYACTGLDRME